MCPGSNHLQRELAALVSLSSCLMRKHKVRELKVQFSRQTHEENKFTIFENTNWIASVHIYISSCTNMHDGVVEVITNIRGLLYFDNVADKR